MLAGGQCAARAWGPSAEGRLGNRGPGGRGSLLILAQGAIQQT